MNHLLACLAGLLACAGALSSGESYGPWRQSTQTDQQGQSWDIDEDGRVNGGTASVVNDANFILVDGDQVGFSGRQMTADGQRFLFTGATSSGLRLERRVRIDPRTGVVRWVETLTNPGATPAQATLMLYCRFNFGWSGCLGDSGGNAEPTPGPQESAIAVQPAQPNQPSVLFVFRHPRAKAPPMVNVDRRNNQMVMTTWSIEVPARGTASVVHAMAQRSGRADAAALQALLRECRGGGFLADLPPEIRRSIVNWGGAGDGGGWSVPADLVPAPGEAELLVVGDDTRLRGSASAESIAIATGRGTATVPFPRVAALGGGARGRVFLRDGQVLAGAIVGNVRFTLASGLATSLTPDGLGWLVRCGLDKAPPHRLVHCADGSILAATGPVALPFATSWGLLSLPLDQVRTLAKAEGALVATLEDGSRLVGHLAAPLEVPTEFFGVLRLDPLQVVGAGRIVAPDEEERTPGGAQFELAGEQILVGEAAARELRLVTPAGELPVLVGQIREMQIADGVASADLWGGDTISGRILQRSIAVRALGGEIQVPVDDLVHIRVPSPAVSPETRERVTALVRDLGHEDWQRREAAARALREIGEPARAALEEAVRASGDAEIRARADALLKVIE